MNKMKNRNYILIIVGVISSLLTPFVYQFAIFIIRSNCIQGSYGGCSLNGLETSAIFVYGVTSVWVLLSFGTLITGVIKFANNH